MKKLTNTAVSRRTFLGGAAAASMLGLAACGGDNGGGDAPAEGGTEGGGTITAGSAYAATNFNPATTSSALSLGTNWHVVEGLYGINYHDYTTFPELATGDPTQVDETTYEVTLREGAKFSDGNAVTPEDVIESFNRANAKDNIYVRSMKLNGRPLKTYVLPYRQLVKGGTLTLVMDSEPNTKATK